MEVVVDQPQSMEVEELQVRENSGMDLRGAVREEREDVMRVLARPLYLE